MDPRTFPTKGNLMSLIDEARDIQDEIDSTFTYAYQCLQRANIEHGINIVSQLAYTVPIENSISIRTRSIMGTEIPHVKYAPVHEPMHSVPPGNPSTRRPRHFRK